MFFAASKLLGAVLEPITFLVLLGFAGIALSLARDIELVIDRGLHR